ncbi:MAG: polysaccharide biosynthesis protein [Rhodocyclaceae bacterium]|nr:polysaccharide biosynthesis protein [Rhodocyclaceae bacterium]MCA3091715.1 polysaccharide biosynthesis protein [Rhodocyclaceae bacterium]MCA3093391.1 polysaccharide biosynthesis protein [Rhodocyclaceae bacterium]MCA3096208.1 polysaccharide biosynthesis protein [Rhodocyclaceae bacterium]MCA3101345.1 polysaccharide biosynthesis protein [Rhodocyclaceae bacterium]
MQVSVRLRTALAIVHDVVAAGVAWCAAFWLRFNLEIPEPFFSAMLTSLAWVVPLQAAVFWMSGLYRGIWRYASVPDVLRIVFAVLVAAMAVAMVLTLQGKSTGVPRSVLILDPLLLAMAMGGSRILYRIWREQRQARSGAARSVYVLGAGDAAAGLIKEFSRSGEWRVVALFDDNTGRHGRSIHGVKVFGALDTLRDALVSMRATHAIIAMPSASHQDRKRAADLANAAGLQVLTVPSFDDLVSGKVTVSQIRAVELDDLLGRDPVVLDSQGLNGWIADRVVMVTGAGGSIGSELCRQIARFGPRLLVMVESSEFSLYQVEQEFAGKVRIVAVAGDVRSPVRMAQVMRQYRPTVVLHAAAYKHVPLMETDNCAEAVLNNVAGTWSVAQAAVDAGVEKFVFVSTDKAVNPTNVMGATKRLAEIVCERLQETTAGTRFVMVRFGNVLGSAGSVIPRFRDQIAAGGPVTVTHPEITRFFMSIPEAAQLVLQAGLMGKGGEIFVLDMGEPVRIADLARSMIRLSGFSEDEIRIVYSGLRPGEKLFEELLADDETTLPTPHHKLRIAQARPACSDFLERLALWLTELQSGPVSDGAVKQKLAQFVPEYQPQQLEPEGSHAPS